MQIDPFILVAQIVNFLILVFLLKRFLYGPIVRMMDQREAEMKQRVEKAEQTTLEAERAAQAYREDREALEAQREELLARAAHEAEERRAELMRQVREDVDEMENGWRDAVERARVVFLRDLRQRAGEQVVSVARKALADLADAPLEQQVVQAFTRLLNDLGDGQQEAMIEQIRASGGKATLASAFELAHQDHALLSHAVHGRFGNEIALDFRTVPHLICGVELRTEGRKISWSLDSYLDALEENVAAALAEISPSPSRPDEAPDGGAQQ